MSGAARVLWQKNPALAWREIEEDTVIISPTESVMHELNDTGSFIWNNIDGRRSVQEIAALLAEGYEVTPEVALADTESLLEELASRKLIVAAESPGNGGSH